MTGALRRQYRVLAALGLDVEQIMRLTPRQRHELYGEEQAEVAPVDPKARLAQLLELAKAGLVKAKPEQLEELKRRLAADGRDPGKAAQRGGGKR
jgi:hypothetical protein